MATTISRRLCDLAPGERVLVGINGLDHFSGEARTVPLFSIRTVVDAADPDAVQVRAPEGGIEIIDRDGRVEGESAARDGVRRQYLKWTNSLPSGTEEQVLAFASVVGAASMSDRFMEALFLYVEDVADGRIAATPVYPLGLFDASDAAAEERTLSGDPPPAVEGNAVFHGSSVVVGERVSWACPIGKKAGGMPVLDGRTRREGTSDISVGDLIGASDFDFMIKGGDVLALLANAVVVGNFPTRQDVGRFLPWGAVPKDWDDGRSVLARQFMDVADEASIDMEFSRARARTEPDKGLFLWFAEDPDRPKVTSGLLLAHKGIIFHEVTDAADYFWNAGIEEGFWVIEDVTMWSSRNEGEYDCGIEGRWRAADAKDLEDFGLDISVLGPAIAAAIGLDGEDALLSRIVEMARGAHGEGAAEAKIGAPR